MRAPTRRPVSRGAAAIAAAALGFAFLLPAIVAAATVLQLRDLAISYGMGCTQGASNWTCTRTNGRDVWTAYIAPTSGDEEYLDTLVRTSTFPLENSTTNVLAWMIDMHATACGSAAKVDAYVRDVAALSKPGNAPTATIGACEFTGYLAGTTAPYLYAVSSHVLPPPTAGPTPTPTPTPTATPSPTPNPTPSPTPNPTPTPSAAPATATPTPSAKPSLGPDASPSASPSAVPSSSPSGEPSEAPATVAPTPSPVVGGVATAEPSDGPAPTAAPGAGATPAPSLPTFEGAVLGITDVNTDGGAMGGSLLLALLLLLIIGFIGELFNNTVENNYDEIRGWFRKGPLGWFRRATDRVRVDPPGRPGVLLFIGLTALVSSFVDPGFGLNLRSVAIFLGFLVGLIVVLASFKLPPILARKRKTGELAQLRPLPWALAIAAIFVLVSRVAHLQPGYLYGIVLGAIFVSDVSDRDEGRETFFGLLWTLVAAVLAWVGLTWLRGQGLPADGFGAVLLSTALAATMVAGLEAAAFALMPLRFMPGYAIYRWNRPVWALLWGLSLFAFIHVLIGPSSGYVSELSPSAFMAALGVFAAFGALSIATWLYFRFRHPPVPESVDLA